MFNIIQRRKTYFLLSGILLSASIIAMIISMIQIGTPFRVGVDFRSGTRFEVSFIEQATEKGIRDVFDDFGFSNVTVTSFQNDDATALNVNAWQIRTDFIEPEIALSIESALAERVASLNPEGTQVQSVSAAVGSEVRQAAIVAVSVSAAVILLYIMFVFRQVPNPFRYGASAVAAMLHDVVITLGFISIAGMLFGWEVDSLFLTAILTVAGFSLQDTIVVFDRIRENITRRPFEDYETIVNRSILETIHRSLSTQLAAMFILVAILLFGGDSVKPFIAALFVGMLSGTYSSIFTAVPLLAAWDSGEIPFLSGGQEAVTA